MVFLWLPLFMAGIVLVLIGFAAIFDGEGWGVLFLILGVIVAGVGIAKTIESDHRDIRRHHQAAYQDLRSEGWNIKWGDIHYSDDVDIACVNFDIQKIGSKYQVVTKRAASVGGGYNIIHSDRQAVLEKACSG